MGIGVADVQNDRKFVHTHTQTQGAWIFNSYNSGATTYSNGAGGSQYARALVTGDKLDVYLDLKKGTLAFGINKQHHGVAIHNVPKDKKYNLIVTLYHVGESVKLIKA